MAKTVSIGGKNYKEGSKRAGEAISAGGKVSTSSSDIRANADASKARTSARTAADPLSVAENAGLQVPGRIEPGEMEGVVADLQTQTPTQLPQVQQPSPSNIQAQPFTQGGATPVGASAVQPTGAATSPFPTNVQSALDQAEAAIRAKGGQAPQDAGAARGAIQQVTPPTPQASIADTLFQEDPFFTSLQQKMQEYFQPENQRKSLVQEYKSLLKESGIQELDAELLDMKNVIEGSEDDIRTEVTKAGGFATDSQVLALTNARNKQLIKNYNTLLETRNSKEQYLDKMMTLTAQDRQMADQQFNNMMNWSFQMANYQQQMKQNAIASIDRSVQAMGWDGVLNATQNDPYTMALLEKTYGMPAGGLQAAAQRAIELKQQEEDERAFDKRMALDASARGWAGIDLQREQLEYQKEKDAEKSTAEQPSFREERVRRVEDAVNQLLPEVSGATVGVGKLASFLPGSRAADFEAKLEYLKSNIFSSELQAMRESSKTGGAVGNVSDREGDRFANALGALSTNQSPKAFREGLNTILDSIKVWNEEVSRLQGGTTAESGQGGGGSYQDYLNALGQ